MAGATKRTGTSPTRIGCEIEPAAVLGAQKNWGEKDKFAKKLRDFKVD
jgi:hypothetical protein